MPSDRVHLAVEDARALGERAMRAIGYEHEEARIVTDHVVTDPRLQLTECGLRILLSLTSHPTLRDAGAPG